MSADMRPADYDVDLIAGDDWTLVVTAVDEAGDAVDLSAATITADVLTTGANRTVTDTITDAVSGAGSNIITLSLTDTETAATILAGPVKHLWSLTVTIGTDTRQWLAGEFNVWPRGDSRAVSSSGTAVTATVDNTVTLTVTAAGGIPDTAATVGITDSGAYYTGTDVEAALQEIGAGTTLDARYANITGDTFTGDIVISETSPSFELNDTNGAADRKRLYWFKVSEKTYLRSLTDAGAKIVDWLEMDDDTGTLDVSEATALQLPATLSPKTVNTPIDMDGEVIARAVVIEDRTGAPYTLVLDDAGKTILVDDDVTVPKNATTAFPDGSPVTIIATASGVSLVEDTGVTVQTARTLNVRAAYSWVTVVKGVDAGNNEWYVTGDLSP